MASVAYVFPRTDGTADASNALISALTGEKGKALHGRRVDHGFTRIKVWHQETPTKATIVYLEAPNLEAAFAKMAADGSEHNTSVSNMIEKVHGNHPHSAATRPMSKLVMDWHPEKGHSTTHH